MYSGFWCISPKKLEVLSYRTGSTSVHFTPVKNRPPKKELKDSRKNPRDTRSLRDQGLIKGSTTERRDDRKSKKDFSGVPVFKAKKTTTFQKNKHSFSLNQFGPG